MAPATTLVIYTRKIMKMYLKVIIITIDVQNIKIFNTILRDRQTNKINNRLN